MDEFVLMTRDGKRAEDPEPVKCDSFAPRWQGRCDNYHRPDNEGFLIFDAI